MKFPHEFILEAIPRKNAEMLLLSLPAVKSSKLLFLETKISIE